MDALFSREELSGCLLYKSDKSKKPGLDGERVHDAGGEEVWRGRLE